MKRRRSEQPAEVCVVCGGKTTFAIHGHCPVHWEELGVDGRNAVVTRLGFLDQREPGVQCGIEMSAAEKLRLSGTLAK